MRHRRGWIRPHPVLQTGAKRSGMTLLEVVVALAIFLLTLIPIYMLVSMGTARALDVQQQAQASMLCQSKMAEIIAGAEPLSGSGFTPFKDPFPNNEKVPWQYRVEASEADVPHLWNVRVSVQLERADGKITEASLEQMVLNPAQRGSTLEKIGAGSEGSSSSSGPGSSANGANSSSGDSSNSSKSGSSGMGNKASGGVTAGKTGSGAAPGGGTQAPAPRTPMGAAGGKK